MHKNRLICALFFMLSQALFSMQVDPETYGSLPLHFAVIEGDLQKVKFLLSQGNRCNVIDLNGSTPFHYACQYGPLAIVKTLMEGDPFGAANARTIKNRDGKIPVELAVAAGHLKIVQFVFQDHSLDKFSLYINVSCVSR